MSAFIELCDGVILNLNNVSFISTASNMPESKEGKRWSVHIDGESIQITDQEYNLIKKYYQTQQELY